LTARPRKDQRRRQDPRLERGARRPAAKGAPVTTSAKSKGEGAGTWVGIEALRSIALAEMLALDAGALSF
jgi:hypothetical protein